MANEIHREVKGSNKVRSKMRCRKQFRLFKSSRLGDLEDRADFLTFKEIEMKNGLGGALGTSCDQSSSHVALKTLDSGEVQP